jgi:DNA topoisomerase-1
MGKSLVIVESPAKAKTINRYLGDDFIVKSSVGHVRDLPVSGGGSKTTPKERAKEAAYTRSLPPEERERHKARKAHRKLIERMGVDPEHGWEPRYEILPGKEKVLDELRRIAERSDRIYLATDLDREGEAIAWHLREVIGGDNDRFDRVVFNEITRKAIQEAFKDPGKLDLARVEAQQARRFLDRVVGFMLSPLLWEKIARGLSAGRVQSVAVELVVEREREIRAFKPEEFWELHADTRHDQDDVRLQVQKYRGENFRPDNGDDARAHEKALREAGRLAVVEREDRPTRSKPSAPFITSTLQQAASTRLGFSVKKTMTMAQRLYEAGHITYMRTDSTNLSNDAVAACREWIGSELGERYLPEKPVSYSSREGAQEAHEAIRPSDVERVPESLRDMDRDAVRLYDLIRRQFIACQMPAAEYLSSTVTAKAGDYELKTRGRIMKFDGWTRIQPPVSRKGQEDTRLPDLKKGDELVIQQVEAKQHFTKPPARYTEASLVKELEKRGIGRPSTYASIISTIQDRGYVKLENRRFYAEKMGDIVTDRLAECFPNLMDYSFTARMEETLDRIAEGELNWRDVLNDFYDDFTRKLESARGEGTGKQARGGMRANLPTDTDIECPECGRPMQVRTGSTGVFLGCSGYSLPPKERCTATLNLIPGEEAVSADDDEEAEALQQRRKKRCPKCGTAMDSYLIDEKRKLHICGNNPDCDGFQVEQGEFRIKGYDGPTLECDKCGSEMQLRSGRFGKYFACTNDNCKNTRKLLRNGEPAPPKADPVPMPHLQCEKVDDHYLLRDGASGLFLAASQFPKNRETRAPLIEEIQTVADQLDPKHKYIAEAPATDPDGNKAVLKYSRKEKEQYVMTEKDGKPTGWYAFYRDGAWHPEQRKKPAKKKAAKKKAAKKKTAKKKAARKKTAAGKTTGSS